MSAAAQPVRSKPQWAELPIRIREAQVVRRSHVTPAMIRITLGGPGMAGFESHLPDEHVKLVFPDPETGRTRAPVEDGDHLDWPAPFPPTREYTVRRYDAEAGEVDFDFVVHPGGLASTWAQQAPIGSSIWIAGPRPPRTVPVECRHLVLLGDETALPAIGRWLEEMPEGLTGVAAVEIAGSSEEQDLPVPNGFTLHWLHRGDSPAGSSALLAEFAHTLTLPGEVRTYVWAAAEAGSIKPVRAWARSHGVTPAESDIGGYWKVGVTRAVPTSRRAQLAAQVRHGVAHLLGREH